MMHSQQNIKFKHILHIFYIYAVASNRPTHEYTFLMHVNDNC
jgi:hypothetical protein